MHKVNLAEQFKKQMNEIAFNWLSLIRRNSTQCADYGFVFEKLLLTNTENLVIKR
ncbi:YvbH-like oligomerization domain-containing protein [Bacillus pacificus]